MSMPNVWRPRLVRARSPRRIVPPGHLPLLPSSLRHAVSNTPLQLPPPCCCWQTAAYLFLVTSFSVSSRLHILISMYVLFKPPLSCSLSPRSPSYSASAYTRAHARLHPFLGKLGLLASSPPRTSFVSGFFIGACFQFSFGHTACSSLIH